MTPQRRNILTLERQVAARGEGDAKGGGRCTHGVTLPLGTLRLAALRADVQQLAKNAAQAPRPPEALAAAVAPRGRVPANGRMVTVVPRSPFSCRTKISGEAPTT